MPTLTGAMAPYASLNDHTPGQGQYRDVERLIRMAHKQAETRSGKKTDPEWYRERMRKAKEDLRTVPAFYQRVAELMTSTKLLLSTHDDDTVEKVDEQIQLGASVCEFPVTFEAAEYAQQNGMAIIVGAPNIVRGGSQSGNLNAADLVQRGLADVICADYHSPSMLPAAFRLVSEGLLDLPAAIRMLTLNAANAVGLTDRGELTAGKLGDLAIVRLDIDGWPHVEATIVGGRFASHFVRHPEVHKPQPVLPAVPQPGTEELVGA
jgi:alpha-D-ribose 1-methylphosphonate 5-triphosphate diphosphatase